MTHHHDEFKLYLKLQDEMWQILIWWYPQIKILIQLSKCKKFLINAKAITKGFVFSLSINMFINKKAEMLFGNEFSNVQIEVKEQASKVNPNLIHKQEHLLQKLTLLLGRKLLVVSSNKGRHIEKGTRPLLLHLLKLLQKLFPLIRSYFSSSTRLPLNFKMNKSNKYIYIYIAETLISVKGHQSY